jgi:hypothetical protein
MWKLVPSACALLLLTGVMAGCTDSGNNRVGENPSERSPAASPPTAPTPPDSNAAGASATPDSAPRVAPDTGAAPESPRSAPDGGKAASGSRN